MTSFQRARYALWNHTTQAIKDPVAWRLTPKSKKYVAIVRPISLAGTVRVIRATASGIEVRIDDDQARAVAHWASGLPSSVMRSTAETHGVIVHSGHYGCIDSTYVAAQLPKPGDRVYVRLTVGVDSIGPLRKTQLQITDVRLTDVAQCE
jgi:hypothetical protein